jgi:hypothetical protein
MNSDLQKKQNEKQEQSVGRHIRPDAQREAAMAKIVSTT